MPQSLSKIYIHIVFSTKNRRPLIGDGIKNEVWAYIGGICKNMECNPVRVGGHDDHVHICCTLSKKVTTAKLLEEIKKESSRWIKTRGVQYENFHWQDGYGVFSVKPSDVERVSEYIVNQAEHHKKRPFQEELLTYLKKNRVEHDERYLWG